MDKAKKDFGFVPEYSDFRVMMEDYKKDLDAKNTRSCSNMCNDMKPAGSTGYRFIKRTFDILCSVILMIFAGIVIAVSAIFIKIEDRGPVFIKQREQEDLVRPSRCINSVP